MQIKTNGSGGLPDIEISLPHLLSGVVGILLLILIIAGAATSFYKVDPEQRAVVKRFGAVVRITGPGLHFKLPFGIESETKVATERILKEEFGFRTTGVQHGKTSYSVRGFEEESLMLTGDLNIINVEWVVQYRIKDPVKFLYKMREPKRTLRDISESVMRRVVGNRLGSEVLTVARVEIQAQSREEIQSAMDRYDAGVHIVTVELQDVIPPKRVQPAFNEVNEARQERERTINEAQKLVNQEVPQAEGKALRIVAEAEGYATERKNRALGESARFLSLLEEYDQAREVTRIRLYLEAVNDVLPRVGRVLVLQEGQSGPLPLLDIGSPAIKEMGQ